MARAQRKQLTLALDAQRRPQFPPKVAQLLRDVMADLLLQVATELNAEDPAASDDRSEVSDEPAR